MGCRRRGPRAEFVRLVRRADGVADVDASGVAPGRGGYLCRSRECFARARKRIAVALRAEGVSAALEDEFMTIVSKESE
jgi:predicted RNA-binding protein YlxR (DUF448 family)